MLERLTSAMKCSLQSPSTRNSLLCARLESMVYRDKSPYTGQMDYLNGKTCFGYVVEVDNALRRARVKTIGKVGMTDDLDLQNVQWISLSLHPSGDDTSALHRIGSYCVVMFINAEPYLV